VTEEIEIYKRELTYGWGVIPAKVTLGTATVTTSLFPKRGTFYIPLKVAIRKPNGVELGDQVRLTLSILRVLLIQKQSECKGFDWSSDRSVPVISISPSILQCNENWIEWAIKLGIRGKSD
jgi:hypothetical protein